MEHPGANRDSPLETWASLPLKLEAAVQESLCHPAVKTLFQLWGGDRGTIERFGFTFVVDPDDPSVSTEFVNGYRDHSALSLSPDGLSLIIESGGENTTFSVAAEDIDEVWRYEAWSEHIHLQ